MLSRDWVRTIGKLIARNHLSRSINSSNQNRNIECQQKQKKKTGTKNFSKMEKGLHPSIDSLRAHAASEGQFAPVVLTFSEPAGLDVCDAYLAVRRGENSFCFVHDDVVVIGTEPVAVVATRGVDQPASASPFLSNAKQVDPLVEMSAHLSAFSIAGLKGQIFFSFFFFFSFIFVCSEPFRHAQSELNGVLFGFVGFDAIRSFEPSIQSVPAPDVLQIPESVLFQVPCSCGFEFARFSPNIQKFASLIVIKDGTVYVSALCPLQTLEESYDVCVARVRELQSRLLSATGSVVRTVRDFDGPPSNGEGKSNFGREGYHSHVSFLKQRIVAGDMVQTVPSHRLEV
jgi:anthranilate/para-aminobenzoate synthase component I